MILLALLAAQTQVAPPRGVNEAVLGTAEQFATKGPARVCFNQGAIDIVEGETAFLKYLGIHSVSVDIAGKDGVWSVSEGDSWATPEKTGVVVPGHPAAKRFGKNYAVYGRPAYAPDHDRLIMWVKGKADPALLGRITPVLIDRKTCTRGFAYGLFFDDEAAQP